MAKFQCFLISNIAFYVFIYVCSTSSLSIHLLINIYIASMSWLLFLDQVVALQRIPCDIFFSLLLPLKFFKKNCHLNYDICVSLFGYILFANLCAFFTKKSVSFLRFRKFSVLIIFSLSLFLLGSL